MLYLVTDLYIKKMAMLFAIPMLIKKNLGKKHCCPFNNAFKCLCYEGWANEISSSYILWSHKKRCWCGLPISFHQSTLFKSPQWPVNALAFLLDTIRTNTKVLLAKSSNLILCQHLNLLFISESSLLFKPYSITLKIVTVSKAIPCRRKKEYFVSKIFIVPSEM